VYFVQFGLGVYDHHSDDKKLSVSLCVFVRAAGGAALGDTLGSNS
jgi:hypothetical protein